MTKRSIPGQRYGRFIEETFSAVENRFDSDDDLSVMIEKHKNSTDNVLRAHF